MENVANKSKTKAAPNLNLGSWRKVNGAEGGGALLLPSQHLVTHGVVVGMTGSGKTGLAMVLAEEALRAGVPTLIIDIKGDLPNLLLAFPDFNPQRYAPWLEEASEQQLSALERQAALSAWSVGEAELSSYANSTALRVLTPGANSGEPLHVLSSLERRSARWDSDVEAARAALSAAVSLVLRLLGRDPDPAKSREHVFLCLLAERRLLAGANAELQHLMQDVLEPPMDSVGALPVNAFLKKSERAKLAAALNTLLASPSFASWRQGTALDVGEWLKPKDGRTPGVVVSVAHLDDEERALVLGVVLEEVLSWVRSLPGSQRLKALILFDEVYGYLPPYPANPPTKRPIVSLMKQARAFGVGVVVATQNPMDLDYRALSNAGFWCLGRLQTEADRERVLDGLCGSDAGGVQLPSNGVRAGHDGNVLVPSTQLSMEELEQTIQRLANRWFLVRNVHAAAGPVLLHPRFTFSWLRGPMTRQELLLARQAGIPLPVAASQGRVAGIGA
jgi:hypothetical protein